MLTLTDAPPDLDRPPAVRLFVPGVPAPGGSKRAFRHRHSGKVVVLDDGKGNGDWKARVASFASRAWGDRPPLEGPLEVWAVFTVARPAGHFRTGRNAALLRAAAPAYPATKPDATKLWRAAEDALTGVLWRDDAQVVDQHVRKVYGDRPGVAVVVRAL